jgi:hypothetical protein
MLSDAVSLAPEVSLKALMKRLLRSSPAEAVVIRPASRPAARIGFFMMTPSVERRRSHYSRQKYAARAGRGARRFSTYVEAVQ